MIPLRSYLGLLSTHLARQRARVALLSLALAGSTALLLLIPQLTRLFIDRATAGRPIDDLVPLAVAFIAVALIGQTLAVAGAYLSQVVGWTATNELRMELADHVLDLDLTFHKRRTPGELIERIDGDVAALANFFSAFAVQVVANAVLLAGILVLLWVEHPVIGLSATAFAGISFASMTRLQRWAVPRWEAVRASAAEFYGFAGEQLSSTEDIKANGGDPFMMRRVMTMLAVWLPRSVAGWQSNSLLWSITTVLHNLGLAVMLLLGAHLFTDASLSLGAVYLVFTYMSMAAQPLERIRSQMADLQRAGAGIHRIRRLLATETRLPDLGRRHLRPGPAAVSIRNLTFAYDDGADGRNGDGDREIDGPVLADLSVELAPGSVLGVLGRTGCGKTTLARLLTRLYDPTSGAVAIDGIPIPQLATSSLRRQVGMVTQDVQLFDASVRDNLTFFDRSVPDDRIRSTLDTLGLADWLRSLPQGLDTGLDGRGGGLSAGQAQLLAFARVFLRDPGLIILDEASSRLDPATEQLIEHAVDRLLIDRTAVIIAHRLATVARADEILILDSGRVIEYGPRTALLADPTSHFNRLLATGLEEVLA